MHRTQNSWLSFEFGAVWRAFIFAFYREMMRGYNMVKHKIPHLPEAHGAAKNTSIVTYYSVTGERIQYMHRL